MRNWLYKFDIIRTLKDYLRPIKQAIFGKDGIYYVVSEIATARKDFPLKIVFDIGAAYGDTARTFGKVFNEATVYCFEPQPESMARLERRTRHLKDRLKMFPLALLNRDGEAELNVLSYADASSFLPLQKYFKDQGIVEVGKISVPVVRLDDFVKEQNLAHIDFVKIDVEGVERELLEGGSETFRDKVDNVFIEISPLRKGMHSGDYIEVFKFFHERGFTFMGCFGDYFFSKDVRLLRKYFGNI